MDPQRACFGATFTRTDGSTGAAATLYFATSPRETADPTPAGFTPAAGVDKLPTLPRSGELVSLAYKLSTDAQFKADWTAANDNLSHEPWRISRSSRPHSQRNVEQPVFSKKIA